MMNMLEDSIVALSQEELDAEQKVIAEFSSLTNSQIYEHIFTRRIFLPIRNVANIDSPSDILGTNSCELMLPTLQKTIQSVLSKTSDSQEFHLLDIEAGPGEVIDWFFAKELEKNVELNRQNIIHIIEPNSNLLQYYQQKLCGYTHLSQGIVYNGRAKDYFKHIPDDDANDREIPLPLIPLDFINCLYTINHLFNITSSKNDPSDDVISFCKFIYSILKPGGAIYIAYLDALEDLFNFSDIDNADSDYNNRKIQKIISSRNSLLYDGEIIDHLYSSELNESEVYYDSDDAMETNSRGFHKRKIKTIPKFNSYKSSSSLYARSLADMAVMLLINQLSRVKNDEKKFDVRLLENILKQIKKAEITPVKEGEKKRFELARSMRNGEMVWKVDIPLIITIIRKEEIHNSS